MIRFRSLAVAALVVLGGCSRSKPAAPAAATAPPPPPELAAAVEEETRLLACLRPRIEHMAAALDASQPAPPQSDAERQCLNEGVARVLAIAVPQGSAASEWWVALETYRTCRGELGFASTSSADLVTLSESASGPEQAAWLRAHLAECAGELRDLDALAKPKP